MIAVIWQDATISRRTTDLYKPSYHRPLVGSTRQSLVIQSLVSPAFGRFDQAKPGDTEPGDTLFALVLAPGVGF